jgi:hypothetical protein
MLLRFMLGRNEGGNAAKHADPLFAATGRAWTGQPAASAARLAL